MKPGAFALLLFLLILLFGAAGGAAGYFLNDSTPWAKPVEQPAGLGTQIVRQFTDTEAAQRLAEKSRRRWAGIGLGGGALLGLLSATAIGSYSLRYRNAAR